MPTESITREELEYKLGQVKMELMEQIRLANEHQDLAFNTGISKLRELVESSRDSIIEELNKYVRHDLLIAKLTPIQAVMYGILGIFVSVGSLVVVGLLAVGRFLATTK